MSSDKEQSSAEQLVSASRGFEYLFCNDLEHAKKHFADKDDPFHLLGLGVCAFMEAALGMETGLMAEATRCLSLSETGARQQTRNPKPRAAAGQRFPPGIEWEILNADAVVLLGLTHALSESYMGYLQCMYSLNSAHSKFTKLYKTVFPSGLDAYATPADTPAPSTPSLRPSTPSSNVPSRVPTPSKSLLARLTGAGSSTTSLASANGTTPNETDGPVEELIIAGTAFGFGLFNLIFSLLPKKVQSVVGFFGYKHDRQLALRALAVSAGKKDVHSVFSGLVLMTYHGVVLLLSGFQADEEHVINQYKAIVESVGARFPEGTLWILNRAKILRMSYDPEGAIRVLREGLRPERTHSFAQADTLLVFELAWTLLGQRKYQEAAETFIRITEINSWSHATYYFLAVGCYISIGERGKAQALLDIIPDLLDKKKVGGKDLPTEVLIKKKMIFYQEKQRRRGGDPNKWAQAIKISVAEELAIFWNTHARIDHRLALAHIREWSALTPQLNNTIAAAATPTPSPLPRSPRTPRPMFGFSHALQPMPSTPNLHPPHSGFLSSTKTSTTTTAAATTPYRSKSASIDSTHSFLGPLPDEEGSNPHGLPDLDTPDEIAIRHLLVGICERRVGEYASSRASLKAACALQGDVKVSTWVGCMAMFELAVLDLKEVEGREQAVPFTPGVGSVFGVGGGGGLGAGGGLGGGGLGGGGGHIVLEAVKRLTEWDKVTKGALKKLDATMAMAGGSVDLSSRLDSRVSMLRDEIEAKREALGIL